MSDDKMSIKALSGKDSVRCPAWCPDCDNTIMQHHSDYRFNWIDIYQCYNCGCRIEVIHSKKGNTRSTTVNGS